MIEVRKRFNLYYIFEEDKRNNLLKEKTAADIWEKVCLRSVRDYTILLPPTNS